MALSPELLERVKDRALRDPVFFRRGLLGQDAEDFHQAWTLFSRRNPFHVLEAPRGFGKTKCTTVGDVVEAACIDPDTRILIVSKTQLQAMRPMSEIRAHFEENKLLEGCFGKFVGTGKWTDTQLTIAQRRTAAQEPTVTALGLEGPITGGHWHHIFVDDPFDEESSRTPFMRDRAFDWLFTTLMPTLLPGGTMRVRCTRYHYEDLAGRIEREIVGEERVHHLEDFEGSIDAMPESVDWVVLKSSAIKRDGASLWESRSPLEDRLLIDPVTGRKILTKGLNSIRKEMGERRFGQQFQMDCQKESLGERWTVFPEVWGQHPYYDAEPNVKAMKRVMYIDPAWSSEKSAQRVLQRKKLPDRFAVGCIAITHKPRRAFITEATGKRQGWIEGLKQAREIARTFQPEVIGVEYTNLQREKAPDFYRVVRAELAPHKVVFIPRYTDKVTHARPLATACERGEVLVAGRLTEFVEEAAAMPYGDYDDLVDVGAGAYNLAMRTAMGSNLQAYARQVDGEPGGDRRGSMGGIIVPGGGMSGNRRGVSGSLFGSTGGFSGGGRYGTF